VLTYNVRGLNAHSRDVTALIERHQPDVMVLTEHTCAREKKKGWFKERSEDTRLAACYTSEARQLGVIVAIKEHLAVLGRATSHTTHALDGAPVHVTLKLPHSAPPRKRCVRTR
jgi:exonuclease III